MKALLYDRHQTTAAGSSWQPESIKLWLGHGHARSSRYLLMMLCAQELSSCNRDHVGHKTQSIYYLDLCEVWGDVCCSQFCAVMLPLISPSHSHDHAWETVWCLAFATLWLTLCLELPSIFLLVQRLTQTHLPPLGSHFPMAATMGASLCPDDLREPLHFLLRPSCTLYGARSILR